MMLIHFSMFLLEDTPLFAIYKICFPVDLAQQKALYFFPHTWWGCIQTLLACAFG